MFDHIAPTALAEACAILADQPQARPLLGGTDLFVQLRAGRRTPGLLVDLKRIPELHTVTEPSTGGLVIGAAVTMNRLLADPRIRERYTVLHAALARIAAYPVRNRATLAGNLANASPAADSAPPLLVLGAELELVSGQGTRRLPLEQFLLGPGRTALLPGELISAIVLPPDWAGCPGYYGRQARRRALDLAIVGVAVLARPTGLKTPGLQWRLAACAVAPTLLRLKDAEAELAAGPPEDARIDRAAALAAAGIKPISDIRAGADYRRAQVEVQTRRGLLEIRRALEVKP